MDVLKLRVHVSARAAIVAAKTAIGSHMLSLTADQLATLSIPLREEIAFAYEANEALGAAPDDPPVVEPTLEAILPVLQKRAETRKALTEVSRLQEARRLEEEKVTTREVAARSNARSRALRLWVERHGDDDMKARMTEGFLPEEEILEDITNELIELVGFDPYEPMFKGDACECGCAGAVKFDVTAPKYLDSHQYSRLQAARDAAPEGAQIEPIEHRAACPACRCLPATRMAIRVSLPWEGWLLKRQFVLK